MSLIAGILLVFLFVTNSYLDIDKDPGEINRIAGDSFSYVEIFKSAPNLPDYSRGIPFHHAQRFIFPYALGLIAKVVPCSPYWLFLLTNVSCIIGILVIFTKHMTLSVRQFSLSEFALVLAVFLLHPYSFRQYLNAPYLINDIIFILGLGLSTLALTTRRPVLLILGFTVAEAARQTGLLLIPGILLWIHFNWPRGREKIALSVLIPGVGVGLYVFTSKIAAIFASKDQNMEILTALADYLTGSAFSLSGFFEFLFRGSIVFLLPLGVFILPTKTLASDFMERRATLVPLIVMVVSCFAQPLSAGPIFTAGNFQRLGMLSYMPILLICRELYLAQHIRCGRSKSYLFLTLAFIFIASMHHVYSCFRKSPIASTSLFIAIYICSSFIIALIHFFFHKSSQHTDA